MLDYTQSFQEFSSSLRPTDVALYAGAAIILWVLFKDKLNPVKSFVNNLFDKIKNSTPVSYVKEIPSAVSSNKHKNQEDVFFDLVSSWKQTRDLAVLSGCTEAVKVADQMFPHLSPVACKQDNKANQS